VKSSWLHHDIEHTAEAVRRFVEREFIDLLARSPHWGAPRLEISAIRFGCQRLVVEFAALDLGPDPLAMAFENVDGAIEASVEQVGWADKLTEPQRATLVIALRGLLDMAAVERVHDRARAESAVPLGPGFADLDRRVTWAEWVERWNLTAGANHDADRNPHKSSLQPMA